MKGRNIKLLIAYDGTDFHGWQKQAAGSREQAAGEEICKMGLQTYNLLPAQRTVQGEIENALEKMHGKYVPLTGSGRTDTGVHAAGQAANFFTTIDSIPSDRFVPALNSLLPKDIRILKACEAPENFHARFSACSRTYRYNFIPCRPALPHESRYNLYLRRLPQIDLLNAYGRLLLGETDCSMFAGSGDSSLEEGKSTYRYIHSAYFFIENDRLIFEIRANAFMRKMVRSIAGTFLSYGEKNTPPLMLREIIASGDRSLAGPTLPPWGLFLWHIEF